MKLAIVKKMLVENSKKNMYPLSFNSSARKKDRYDIDIFKILDLIKKILNHHIKKSTILLKFLNKNEMICEIPYKKNQDFENPKNNRIQIKYKDWCIEQLSECLNFFISSDEIYFNRNKSEIKIRNIKNIYFCPKQIKDFLIEKTKIIQNKIDQKINLKLKDNDEEYDENNFFYTFEDKCDSVAFNILAWIILDNKKKEEEKINKEFINLLQSTNAIKNKNWLKNSRFFKNIHFYLFERKKENLQKFLEKLDSNFKKHFDSITLQIKLINEFKTLDVDWDNFDYKERKENEKDNNDWENSKLIKKIKKSKQSEKKIESNIYDFSSLLEDYEKQIISISYYQRSYVWTEKLISDLFYDINNCEMKSNHYLNHILVEKSDSSDNKIYKIIDGQQRIISLLIIYAVCIKFAFFKKIKISKKDWDFFKEPTIRQPKFEHLSEEKNDETIEKILKLKFDGLNLDKKETLVSNIFKIIELVVLEFYDQEDKFNLFLNKLKYNFIFTITTIYKREKESPINTFLTFNNLNSKMQPLNSLELLKSYLFLRNQNDHDMILFLDKKNWGDNLEKPKTIETEYKIFQENINKFKDQDYNFARTIYLGIKDLDDKFQEENNSRITFDNLKKIIDHYKSNNKSFLKDLKKINEYFQKYSELFDPEELKKSEKSWIKDNLDYLMPLSNKDFSSYRPFIYKLFQFINKDNYKANHELIREILYVIETYILRSVCVSTHYHAQWVNSWVKKLNKIEDLENLEWNNFERILNKIPTNNDLQRVFKEKKYKLNNIFITKLILVKIERVLAHCNLKIWSKNNDQVFWTQEYQIEHIISVKDKFFEDNEAKEQIGNKMLLTPEQNKSIGNKYIWEKRKYHNNEGFYNKKLFLSSIDDHLKKTLKNNGFKTDDYEFPNFEEINKDNKPNKDIENSPELKKEIIEDITKVIKNRSSKLLNWIQLIWNEKPVEWIKQQKN